MTKWFNYLRIESGPGDGNNPAWWLHHRSLARGVDKNCYLLANEWICGCVGWYLRLPVPPFALMRKSPTSRRYFGSLDYGAKQVTPTDMRGDRLCVCLPNEATGVILFDALVANPDRHEGNLKVDDRLNPTRIELFDHDQGMFGIFKTPKDKGRSKGASRLALIEKAKDLGWGHNLNSRQVHKLACALKTARHMNKWYARIESIPDHFLETVCAEAPGISARERDAAFEFLRNRKTELRTLVNQNKGLFPKVKDWGLL